MMQGPQGSADPIKTAVIVGGGSAGWMTAAALARAFAPHLRVTLVESDEIGTVGVGEATIPQIKVFNEFLGLDEDAFVRETNGTFKLGIVFNGWSRPGASYIHAFGEIGAPAGMLPFYQHWLHAAASGVEDDLWDYSLNAVAARAGRFGRLRKIEGTSLGGLAYAFHFDASLYAALLRRYAEGRGVDRIEGRVAGVARSGEAGRIDHVSLADGRRVAGDLFIDCSGFRALLIGDALGVGYEDWTHWLPCDRAVAAPCESVGAPTPFTQASADEAGWRWRIPLQHRTGNGYVFCSAFMDADAAARRLLETLDGPHLAEPRLLSFRTGRRMRQWSDNCVSIGLSSGFMEPLESTSIHLIQAGISRLISLFPDRRFDPALIAEYNRQSAFEFERIRDFLILHYHANAREGSEFWRHCRDMALPDALTRKLDLFRSSGRIYREHEELFTELGWLQVLTGQGVGARASHPAAATLSEDQRRTYFASLKTVIARAAQALPSHDAFIRQHCASADMPARAAR